MGSETQILCDVPRDRLLWEFRAPWLCAPGLFPGHVHANTSVFVGEGKKEYRLRS